VADLYKRYGDRAQFLTVYIKEAHPLDEWQMEDNEKQGVCYRQPKTFAERLAIANDFTRRFGYPVPLAVDGMDNHAERLYSGWPERLYVIDEAGKIVYKGEPGPFGYHPEQVAAWLAKRFPGRPGTAS
jgi:type I thyroxine 5'-deiodinase